MSSNQFFYRLGNFFTDSVKDLSKLLRNFYGNFELNVRTGKRSGVIGGGHHRRPSAFEDDLDEGVVQRQQQQQIKRGKESTHRCVE